MIVITYNDIWSIIYHCRLLLSHVIIISLSGLDFRICFCFHVAPFTLLLWAQNTLSNTGHPLPLYENIEHWTNSGFAQNLIWKFPKRWKENRPSDEEITKSYNFHRKKHHDASLWIKAYLVGIRSADSTSVAGTQARVAASVLCILHYVIAQKMYKMCIDFQKGIKMYESSIMSENSFMITIYSGARL